MGSEASSTKLVVKMGVILGRCWSYFYMLSRFIIISHAHKQHMLA